MLIVIPARYASSRFPGKPLTPILGKPLIQWTWEAANRVGGSRVVVATDDFRIKDMLDSLGAEAVMTAPDWANGTERVAEAVDWLDAHEQVVVNWQGDALLIDPRVVPRLVKRLVDSGAPVATPVVDVSEMPAGAMPRGGVEAVLNEQGECLWFTRAPVLGGPFTAHVGMYAYRGDALADYAGWRLSPAERFSGLEQLRWLVEGKRVAALPLAPMPGGAWPEVNYPADVAVVEAALRARGEIG